jgi:hypothetical protein
MWTKIDNIKKTVLKILMEEPETRDNDRLLILKVWAIQNPLLRTHSMTFREFSIHFIAGRYTDTESIRRLRQLIQMRHPELRGKFYKERKKDLNKEMRDNINTTDV